MRISLAETAVATGVTEALSHVARLTQLVRRRTGFGGQEDPASTDEFEEVELGDLPGVPAPTQSGCG